MVYAYCKELSSAQDGVPVKVLYTLTDTNPRVVATIANCAMNDFKILLGSPVAKDSPDLFTFMGNFKSVVCIEGVHIARILNILESNLNLASTFSYFYEEKFFAQDGTLVNTLQLTSLEDILKAPLNGTPTRLAITKVT